MLSCCSFVENTRGINDLQTRVLVVAVIYKQILSSECVRLYPNVRNSDLANERALADIRKTGDDQGAGRGVDDLGSEIFWRPPRDRRGSYSLEACTWSRAQCASALAAVERVTEFEQGQIVPRDAFDKRDPKAGWSSPSL